MTVCACACVCVCVFDGYISLFRYACVYFLFFYIGQLIVCLCIPVLVVVCVCVCVCMRVCLCARFQVKEAAWDISGVDNSSIAFLRGILGDSDSVYVGIHDCVYVS